MTTEILHRSCAIRLFFVDCSVHTHTHAHVRTRILESCRSDDLGLGIKAKPVLLCLLKLNRLQVCGLFLVYVGILVLIPHQLEVFDILIRHRKKAEINS